MTQPPLRIAWISDFPIERIPSAPPRIQALRPEHPLTWQAVLQQELAVENTLELHILVLRRRAQASEQFRVGNTVFHLIKIPGRFRAPSLFWLDTVLIRHRLSKIRPDLVHAWGTERGAALIASRLRYPFLVTLQGLINWLGELVPLRLYHRFAAILENISLKRAPAITTESTVALQYLKRHYPRSSVFKIEHAPDRIFHTIVRSVQQNPIRFVFVGSLLYLKGLDLLIQALAKLSQEMDFELVLIGAPDEPFWSRLMNTASVDLKRRVHQMGIVAPGQIAAELTRATIMVFPTRADNSPNAVKEAAVAGVPVVASAMGAIPEYILEGRNGFLFPAGNCEALVKAIRLACNHPLFRQGLVEPAALEHARRHLSPATMGKEFKELYQTLAVGRA